MGTSSLDDVDNEHPPKVALNFYMSNAWGPYSSNNQAVTALHIRDMCAILEKEFYCLPRKKIDSQTYSSWPQVHPSTLHLLKR
jgi:hypothetical protein